MLKKKKKFRSLRGTVLQAHIHVRFHSAGRHTIFLPFLPCGNLPSSLLLSLSCEGRLGATDDFLTRFPHFSVYPTAQWDSAKSRPVHSLMLSSHLFSVCLVFFPLFTVPCVSPTSTVKKKKKNTDAY